MSEIVYDDLIEPPIILSPSEIASESSFDHPLRPSIEPPSQPSIPSSIRLPSIPPPPAIFHYIQPLLPIQNLNEAFIDPHREEQKENLTSKDQILAELLDMGYSDTEIQQILPICTSTQHAIELLLNPAINENYQGVCSICQTAFRAEPVILSECADTYCKPCLSEYVKIRIEESQVLIMPCPNHECRGQITDEQIRELVSNELYEKFLRFKNVEELNKDPFLKWCPKPDCQGFDKGSLKKSKLECNVCKFEFCFYCGEAWHGKEKCKFVADEVMDKWAYANGVKYCPNCKRKVEKNLGCDHMTCAKCRYEWCWLCGSKYTSGHYDVCEVKKLGKKNPPLSEVLKFFLAPFLFPFFCIIFFYVLVHKILIGNFGSYKLRKVVRENRALSYFFATLLGIIFSPFFFALGPFVLSIGMTADICKNKCCSRTCGIWFGGILGLLLTPVLVALLLIGLVAAHLIGIVGLVWKGYIVLRRCKEPGYLMPNSRYGYS